MTAAPTLPDLVPDPFPLVDVAALTVTRNFQGLLLHVHHSDGITAIYEEREWRAWLWSPAYGDRAGARWFWLAASRLVVQREVWASFVGSYVEAQRPLEAFVLDVGDVGAAGAEDGSGPADPGGEAEGAAG